MLDPYSELQRASHSMCTCVHHWLRRMQELNRTSKIQSRGAAKKAETLAEARERAAFDAKVAAAMGAAMQRNQQVPSAKVKQHHRHS